MPIWLFWKIALFSWKALNWSSNEWPLIRMFNLLPYLLILMSLLPVLFKLNISSFQSLNIWMHIFTVSKILLNLCDFRTDIKSTIHRRNWSNSHLWKISHFILHSSQILSTHVVHSVFNLFKDWTFSLNRFYWTSFGMMRLFSH